MFSRNQEKGLHWSSSLNWNLLSTLPARTESEKVLRLIHNNNNYSHRSQSWAGLAGACRRVSCTPPATPPPSVRCWCRGCPCSQGSCTGGRTWRCDRLCCRGWSPALRRTARSWRTSRDSPHPTHPSPRRNFPSPKMSSVPQQIAL